MTWLNLQYFNANFIAILQRIPILLTALSTFCYQLSHITRKPVFGFPNRSDTNRAVKAQKMATGLKYQIKKADGLYYLCSKNKGADQLQGNCGADLHLCFRIFRDQVFS